MTNEIAEKWCFIIEKTKSLWNIFYTDCRQETDEGARRLLDAVLSDHKSSVKCQSTGTASEEQPPAVYAEGTNAMERCVTEGHQKDLETSASDSEVKFLKLASSSSSSSSSSSWVFLLNIKSQPVTSGV